MHNFHYGIYKDRSLPLGFWYGYSAWRALIPNNRAKLWLYKHCKRCSKSWNELLWQYLQVHYVCILRPVTFQVSEFPLYLKNDQPVLFNQMAFRTPIFSEPSRNRALEISKNIQKHFQFKQQEQRQPVRSRCNRYLYTTTTKTGKISKPIVSISRTGNIQLESGDPLWPVYLLLLFQILDGNFLLYLTVERGKPEYPEKNFSGQSHIWPNPGDIGGRWVLSALPAPSRIPLFTCHKFLSVSHSYRESNIL